MMKVLTPTYGLTLLALAVALTGCPGLETGAKNEPDPQPSASVPEDDQDTEKEPTLALKALGPVRATLQGAPEVKLNAVTRGFSMHYPPLSKLGYLLPHGAQPPADASTFFESYRESSGSFDRHAIPKTHDFYLLNNPQATMAKLDASHFTHGEVAPIGFRKAGVWMELDFPAEATGAITITLPEAGDLHFEHAQNDGTYRFQKSIVTGSNSELRSATVSVTVAVKELDGTPSAGLGAANFRVPESSSIQVTETDPGIYRISIRFDGLEGFEPQAQTFELTVAHASLTHTHQKETP